MPFFGTAESLLASFSAAFSSVMLVLYEGHVQLVFGDRATYTSVFHHKCGVMMLLTMAWAGLETVLFLSSILRERRQDREHRERMRSTRPSSARAAYPYGRVAQTSVR